MRGKRGKRGRQSAGKGRTTTKKSSKRTGPYDADYETKLVQAGIFLGEELDEDGHCVIPLNHDTTMARLNRRRNSLSAANLTKGDFRRFKERTEEHRDSKRDTILKSMAIIQGNSGRLLSGGGVEFNNLELFDPTMTTPVPDFYNGAPPLSIDEPVRKALDRHIVPCTSSHRPAVPNFFVKRQGRQVRYQVALRKAAHAGAIGARGMLSFQNYPASTLADDGSAYTFTSIYRDGWLEIYTTHATVSGSANATVSYYMTEIITLQMNRDSQTFREGATYYRNAQDLAEEQRDLFISQANKAVRQAKKAIRRTEHGTRRTTTRTNTTSDLRTDSQGREHEDSKTSADKPAGEVTTNKQPRTDSSSSEEAEPSSGRVKTTVRDRQASTQKIDKRRTKKP